MENFLVPLWLLDSRKPLHLMSFRGTQHPPNVASQLGNRKDWWPIEVVLVLEWGMKRVRADEVGSKTRLVLSHLYQKNGECGLKKHRGGQKEEGKISGGHMLALIRST